MDDLRLIRRDAEALIVANETGTEFRLEIDAKILSEIRNMHRRERESPRVSPREIQRLVRSGKSRAEIIALTGADENDIIRYEEPVLAERRFILTSAQAVGVRTTPADGSEREFGEVIRERLATLAAEGAEWSTWKDDESGWMVGLEFISHDVAHHAIWSFDHRKAQLSPQSPDAVTLSRQGDVGDRLIPKLRAVEQEEPRTRFETAFDPDALTAGLNPTAEVVALPSLLEPVQTVQTTEALPAEDVQAVVSEQSVANEETTQPSTDTQPILDPHAEFLRRREIDQRSMSTPPGDLPDLSETSDLLDALRRRRLARENDSAATGVDTQTETAVIPASLFPAVAQIDDAQAESGSEKLTKKSSEREDLSQRTAPLRPIHEKAFRSPAADKALDNAGQKAPRPLFYTNQPNTPVIERPFASEAENPAHQTAGSETVQPEKPRRSRGRTAIPSWDDILFGTRSEEDPV